MKRFTPLGIRLLSYIYLVNIILYILSLVLFYHRIIILGIEANREISFIVRLIFVFIPTYLVFGLKRLKKDAWFLAIYFHTFFILNNSLTFLENNGYIHSLIRITGKYGSVIYSPPEKLVLTLNTILNLIILGYLFKKRIFFYLENNKEAKFG